MRETDIKDQVLTGFSSPRTVGISSETVGWIGAVRYLGIEFDDALTIAEQVDV